MGNGGSKQDSGVSSSNGGSISCYLPRDIRKGSYGGDVYCLQRYLQRVGLLKSDPTGYYGEATQMAVQRWQAKNSLRDHKVGTMDYISRSAFARQHGLPQPSDMDPLVLDSGQRFCIDVCSELNGIQDCETRCVSRESDKSHACMEACQLSFGAACDRAYPTSEHQEHYVKCLASTESACAVTCAKYRLGGRG